MDKHKKHFYKLLFKKFQDKRELLLLAIDVLMGSTDVLEDEKLDKVHSLFHKVSQEELAMEAAHAFYKRETHLEYINTGTENEDTEAEKDEEEKK